MPSDTPTANPNGMASSIASVGAGGRLVDRPALPLPARHATFHDVNYLLSAVALQQAGGDGGALPGPADHRDRPAGVDVVRNVADVVIGLVDGAGDVSGV